MSELALAAQTSRIPEDVAHALFHSGGRGVDFLQHPPPPLLQARGQLTDPEP